MIDLQSDPQVDINANQGLLLSHDYELNGTLNQATQEGAKFALVLAMLEQDCLYRPQFAKDDEVDSTKTDEFNEHGYRNSPLSAEDSYWQQSQHTGQYLQQGQLKNAQLWLAMHPEPLSQFNQANDISEEVLANCSLSTQSRLQNFKQPIVPTDETGLFDILQKLG